LPDAYSVCINWGKPSTSQLVVDGWNQSPKRPQLRVQPKDANVFWKMVHPLEVAKTSQAQWDDVERESIPKQAFRSIDITW